MDLYIYYDVRQADASTLVDRVRAMQSTLGAACPRIRLLRRFDRQTPTETWMEVYEGVPPGFDVRLDSAIAAHGLAAWTGPRHVERFVDIE